MNVKIIRSNRKTLAIQINPDLSVTVRAPMYAPQSDIERILREKEGWIQKHIEKIREMKEKKKETQGESMESEYLTNNLLLSRSANPVHSIRCLGGVSDEMGTSFPALQCIFVSFRENGH